MGRKKQRNTSSSCAGGGASSPAPPPPPPPPSVDEAIRADFEEALSATANRNTTKALQLMNQVIRRHGSSALAHRAHAEICYEVACADTATSIPYLRDAAQSACLAASLSPSSVALPTFHAEMLLRLCVAGEGGLDEVVRACDGALAVRHPVDPAMESLSAINFAGSPESRINAALQDLRSLREMCASSSLVLAEVRDKAAAIVEYRLDIKIKNSRERIRKLEAEVAKSNQTKARYHSKIKTPEDRRKEIEVQVAAARLLQLQEEDGGSLSMEPLPLPPLPPPPPTSSPADRLSERKKTARLNQIVAVVERKDQMRSYLKSLSITDRQGLLSVSVSNFSAHISSLEGHRAWDDLLGEAVSFAEANSTFKFWVCCRCNH